MGVPRPIREHGRGAGELELAADERRLGRAEAGHAHGVHGLGLGVGPRTYIAEQRRAQTPIPLDGGMAVPGGQGHPHQLPMGGLVCRLELCQPLPLPTVTQQLEIADPQRATRLLSPLLVKGFGKQVTRIALGRRLPRIGIVARKHGLDSALEPLDIDVDRPVGEQRDLPSSQHDRVVRVEGATRVVRGLAQVRGSGVQVEMRPECFDHLVACECTPICESQQLHELRGAGRRPRGDAVHRAITHDHLEAAEQPDSDRRVVRSRLHRFNLVGVVAIVATDPTPFAGAGRAERPLRPNGRGDRVTLRYPSLEATLEVRDVAVPELLQSGRAQRRPRPRGAVDDDPAVALKPFEVVRARGVGMELEHPPRRQHRPRDHAVRDLGRLAQIDQQHVTLRELVGQFARSEILDPRLRRRHHVLHTCHHRFLLHRPDAPSVQTHPFLERSSFGSRYQPVSRRRGRSARWSSLRRWVGSVRMGSVPGETRDVERVRTAELIGALCLATDLGMGFPFEHGLQETLIAMRLAARLGVERETCAETYYTSLLSHAGCTAEAHVAAEVFGGSLTANFNPLMYGSMRDVFLGLLHALPDEDVSGLTRAGQTARRLPRMVRSTRPALTASCEVAGMLAEQTGAPAAVPGLLAYLTERWDGHGPLGRGKHEAIPLAVRIVHVASDAALQRHLGGIEHTVGIVHERAGHAFDPEVAACLVEDGPEILALGDAGSAWDEALAVEPSPPLMLEGDALDRGLAAMGRFADLVSPYFSGHSTGVAELASEAARHCRIDAAGVTAIRHAGYVHDLGRAAVHARIWQKPGPLSADELEQVRLHPYQTERCLSRSPFLAALTPVAASHHERLDQSGYPHGSRGADLTMPARLLAAADAFSAMCEPRPHRPAVGPERAADALTAEANAGRLDPDAVTAVIEAAGQRAPRLERPARLTEREAEVVALLARGLQTRQVAHELGISVKTADRHVQNAYGKIGVSTRAAATLFAMEYGLVAWGELPIGRPPAGS